MVDADGSERRTRLTELQRRLYRPGATADDLAEYTALQAELAAAVLPADRASSDQVRESPLPADPGPTALQPDPSSTVQETRVARRTSRPLVIAGALAGAAALCAAIVLLQSPGQRYEPVAQASSPAPPLPAVQVQGRVPHVSERFTDDGGTPQGTTVEVAVDGTRVLAQRFSGSGPALVPLITGGAPLDGGLLTVTLHSKDREEVSWQTDAAQDRAGSTSTLLTPTARTSSSGATSVEYRGAPPSRIRVTAPAGTGWTLVVAFSR